ncbi:MAG: insulinase family protein [Bacteroidales bacterium]|jgi:zinc protease|nr:insulinase family protein [Bacteroidales bacterium]
MRNCLLKNSAAVALCLLCWELFPVWAQGKATDEPLLAGEPEGSRVFRRKDMPGFGVTELTFMNGVQVALKPTDFKNDQILFCGFSPGGTSVYADEDYMSAMTASGIVSLSGLGNFNREELDRKLAGNTARLSPYISNLFEGVNGTTAPKDIETILQLNYLYFTGIRRDEDAFAAYVSSIRNQAKSMKNNPLYVHRDTLYKIMTCNDPRTVIIPSGEQIDRIRQDNALYVFQDRFANAGDFKFIVAGKFNVQEIIPLLEKYLGGLPVKQRKETWRNVTPPFPQGIVRFDDTRGTGRQTHMGIIIKGNFRWRYKERLAFTVMTDMLRLKLKEAMEEEQGETHNVTLTSDATAFPKPGYSISIQWSCAPQNSEKMITAVFAEMKNLKNSPTETDLRKAKETLVRNREAGMKENEWWMNALQHYYQQNDKLMTQQEYGKSVQSITTRDVKNIARKYLNENNCLISRLIPEESVMEN